MPERTLEAFLWFPQFFLHFSAELFRRPMFPFGSAEEVVGNMFLWQGNIVRMQQKAFARYLDFPKEERFPEREISASEAPMPRLSLVR